MTKDEMKIIVKNNTIKFVYDDNLTGLMNHGKSETKRASHVEPCDGGWEVDLSPVNGPKFGPFNKRNDALKAEVDWLMNNNIPIPLGE